MEEQKFEATRKTGKICKIVIDKEGCIGARSCVVVAPEIFKMNEENIAYIINPDASDDDILKMSAEACPVLAVHLYDENGNKIFPKE
ncbi:MAG: ferredoxin [Candidatus Magasanikbacteria bacterium]|nr:ferredoxin [Candidatus Magasanikbacteria bacterium]